MALSFVRTADDILDLKALHRRGRRRPARGRQDREEGGARRVRGDHRRGRRGDGRARRPRAWRSTRPLVPIWQKRIIHAAERRRQAGDHGDADAAVDDRIAARRRAPRRATSPTPSTMRPAPSCSRARRPSAATRWRRSRTMAEIALVVEADIEREGRAPQPWAAGRTGVSDAISHGACEVAAARRRRGHRQRHLLGRHRPRGGSQPARRSRSSPSARTSGSSTSSRCAGASAPCSARTAAASRRSCARPTTSSSPAASASRARSVVITAGLQTNQSGKTNLIKAHMLA